MCVDGQRSGTQYPLNYAETIGAIPQQFIIYEEKVHCV